MEDLFKKYCQYLEKANNDLKKGNPIRFIKERFKRGELDFYDFLDLMYQWNSSLQITSENLENTGIKKIEISEEGVVYTTKHSGIRLTFNGKDRRGVPFELLSFGEYEREELKLFDQILADGFTLFDIGANIGWYSLNWGMKYPNSTIYAFEPIEKTHGFCKRNLILNNIQNVQLHKLAISDKSGEKEYFFSPETSVLASSENIMGYQNAQKVVVSVETLDRFVSKHKVQKVDVLKCDVEGAEFLSLKGSVQTIKKDLPIVVLELFHEWSKKFNYHPNEAIEFLEVLGYKAFLPCNGFLEEANEYRSSDFSRQNYFFLHQEKHRKVINRLTVN